MFPHGSWRMTLGMALCLVVAARAATGDPVVRMLVPGFTVQELPVTLSNQNNLRFAPDGSLTTLGYDGRIWRLRDSDGDGLEDRAEPYWDRPTLSVPLGMAWSSAGLYVSSKGKVSLFRDTDGDGRADVEEVVVSGWPATDVGSGGVDATAVTLDRDGNVYFGLLGADYSNAYRLRKRRDLRADDVEWLKRVGRWREPAGPDSDGDEFSLYDLNSPRGTIQRWDPRARTLDAWATGLRVPVALAFNGDGELFNTDQEGETWMPNGNPLDELNHIVRGRNYGFPPRHARWMPDLVSERPVVAFGPQHQSACGLVFNEAVVTSVGNGRGGDVPLPVSPGQALFGPEWWKGDALVAGESRGLIWRNRLVKTPEGYIGKSYAIARLSMLTVDLAISPRGDLYVCCHSGPPDWGTGPQGEGRIFKISYTDRKAPQPVLVQLSGERRVRIVFDRPIDPSVARALVGTSIEFGDHVTAGDEFESLRPPYEVVEQQRATPRGKLQITDATLGESEASDTVFLETEPHPFATTYSVTIDGLRGPGIQDESSRACLAYSGEGADLWLTRKTVVSRTPGLLRPLVRAITGQPDAVSRFEILPHPDVEATRGLLGDFVDEPGSRGVHAERHVDLATLTFRPNLPPDARQLFVRAQGSFAVEHSGSSPVTADRSTNGLWRAVLPVSDSLRAGTLKVTLGRGGLPAHFSFTLDPAGREYPVELIHSVRPDSPTNRISSGTDSRPQPKPRGDWEHGRELFVSPQLNCVKCHRIRGDGGSAGPDLSNLIHRDPASVLRDIRDPGATLHPDYVTYLAETLDGATHVGFLRGSSGDTVRLFDAEGRETSLQRTNLTQVHPTGQSLMPAGLLDPLSEGDVRDLLTYLLHEPPTRARQDIEPLLLGKGTALDNAGAAPFRLVLVASKQDHGPGQHDYPAWQEKWVSLLAAAGSNTAVEKAWEWPSPAQWAAADVVVFYFWNHDWSPARYAELDAYQSRGGGLVLIHSAVIADQDPERLAERIGLSAQPGRTGYRHTPFELSWVAPDPVFTKGMPERISFLDEPYWPLIGDPGGVRLLAVAEVDGQARPMAWTFERGRGRVFASVPGHYFWTLDDPLWRLLCLRGMAWAGRRDPSLLNDAVMRGALVR